MRRLFNIKTRLIGAVLFFIAFEAVMGWWATFTLKGYYLREWQSSIKDKSETFETRFDATSAYIEVTSVVPEVKRFLAARGKVDPKTRKAAEEEMRRIKKVSDAELTFLMDSEGNCLFATNPSLIGNNYGFRVYFKEAMTKGKGFFLAHGVTTHALGFYFASRVLYNGKPVGVVVIKLPGKKLLWSELFRKKSHPLSDDFLGIVTQKGVIVCPDQEFYVLDELSNQAKRQIEITRQFPISQIKGLGFPKGTWTALTVRRFITVKNQQNGETYHLYLEPTRITGISVISILPHWIVAERIKPLAEPIYSILGALFLSFLAMMLLYASWEATKEEVQRLSTAIEQAGTNVVITDKEGNIVYVNPTFEKETGYTKEEVIGKNPRIFKTDYHPREFYKELWKTISSGKTWRGVFKNRRRDGSFFWEDTVITPVFNSKGEITHYIAIKHNITEKVELEDKLKETLNELDTVVNNAPVGIAYTKHRKLIRVNPALASFWEGTVEEIEGQDASIFHPTREQYQRLGQEMIPRLRTGDTAIEELPLRTKTGKIKWARLSAKALHPQEPEEGSIWIIEDITDRKNAENALARKSAILEAVSKASALVLTSTSEKEKEKIAGEFLSMMGKASDVSRITVARVRANSNIHITELMSWSNETGPESQRRELVADANDPYFSQWLEGLRKGEIVRLNHLPTNTNELTMFKEREGCFVPIMVDEKLWGVLALSVTQKTGWHEIEEDAFKLAANLIASAVKRERYQREKEQEERKYTALVEKAQSVIVRSSSDGKILFMNRFGCELLGYKPEEIIGKPLIGTIIPPPNSKGKDGIAELKRIYEDLESLNYQEVENVRSDGKRVWIGWNHVALRNHRGEIIELISVGHDLTERKRIEEHLREASQAKSTFLANMSHEIRTPLNAIIGMSQILKEMPLDGEKERLVTSIYHAGKALLSIINDVLDLAKIEAGMMNFSKEPFNLLQVVEESVEIFSFSINKDRVELISHIAPDVPLHLMGDSRKLGQILRNLLGNALKFTSDGHVVLSVSLDSIQEQTAHITLQVIDTGVGIPQEKLSEIFEPFTQADSGISRKFGGTGLGLAITKELVNGMGGRINIESKEGYGTVVTVNLPFEIDPSPPEHDELETIMSKMQKEKVENRLKVLVLAASRWAERSVSDTLKRLGFNFETVHTQKELLSAATDQAKGFEKLMLLVDSKLFSEEFFSRFIQLKEENPNTFLLCLTDQIAGATWWDNTKWGKFIDACIPKPVFHLPMVRSIGSICCKSLVDLPREMERWNAIRKTGGARILLVEDTELNKVLMKTLISREGHQVVVASNGVEALETLSEVGFDIVLMDVQMPIMDGFTATRIIRACERGKLPEVPEGTNLDKRILEQLTERLRGSHTPIIALTAHAFEDHKQKAQEAGMDGYLSKPFELRQFRVIVSRFLNKSEEAVEPEETPKDPEEKRKVQDKIVERLTETFGIPPEEIPAFLETARTSLLEKLKEAEKAAKEGDFDTLNKAAHTLKGSLANLGLPELSEKAKEMELKAKEESKDFAYTETISKLREEIKLVLS